MNLHEPNTLKVRLHQIKLSREMQPVKVMLTGDWHISPIVSERQFDFLKDAIEHASPDIIVLQGDLVDSPIELKRDTSLKKLYSSLKLCTEAAPTILVLGSHDFITPTTPARVMKKFALPFWQKLCQKTGVKLLLDEWYEIKNVRFFGAFQDESCMINEASEHKEDLDVFLEKVKNYDFTKISPDKVNWFVTHAPYLKKKTLTYLADFDVLSFGHTHGGVVPKGMDEIMHKLHLHFGLVSPNKRPFAARSRGAIKVGKSTTAIINPGMVGAQFCAPKIIQSLNFIKAAEIDLVEIKGAQETQEKQAEQEESEEQV